ncbi:hypothetical protein SLEP1_g60493, partial [Rubroshorea leprosula]
EFSFLTPLFMNSSYRSCPTPVVHSLDLLLGGDPLPPKNPPLTFSSPGFEYLNFKDKTACIVSPISAINLSQRDSYVCDQL